MTELEVRSTSTEISPFEADSDLMRWARDAREAHTIALSLVKTSFVPQSMKGKPEEAAAAILTGSEVGLTPMAALRSIDIINGTPAMRAHALRGLVQSRGHEIWVEDAEPTRAVVKGHRKGSTNVQESVWTLDRARGLGLLVRDNWKKQPQAMLVARATSELCRLIASDVMLGLPYSIEELSDETAEVAETVAAPKKVSRRAVAPTVEAPPLEEVPAEPVAEVEPEPAVEPTTDWPPVAEPPSDAE